MAPRKHRLGRVLGLSLIAAIGLLAISAVAAQAEGEWKIGGKTLPELNIEEESLSASLDGTFIYTVPSLSLEIKCLKVDSLKGRVLLKGAGELSLLFLECTFFAGKSQEKSKLAKSKTSRPACPIQSSYMRVKPISYSNRWKGKPLSSAISSKVKNVLSQEAAMRWVAVSPLNWKPKKSHRRSNSETPKPMPYWVTKLI